MVAKKPHLVLVGSGAPTPTKPKHTPAPAPRNASCPKAGAWLEERLLTAGYPVLEVYDEDEEGVTSVVLIDDNPECDPKKKGVCITIEYDASDPEAPISMVLLKFTTRNRITKTSESIGFSEEEFMDDSFKLMLAMAASDLGYKFDPKYGKVFDVEYLLALEDRRELQEDLIRVNEEIRAFEDRYK